MTDEGETIVSRIVERFPVEPRLARLVMAATIEEVHRLLWITDGVVDVAQHLRAHLGPESCSHFLSVMQYALDEAEVGDDLYEGLSQRLPASRNIMIAKVQEWRNEQPESRARIDAARIAARKARR